MLLIIIYKMRGLNYMTSKVHFNLNMFLFQLFTLLLFKFPYNI